MPKELINEESFSKLVRTIRQEIAAGERDVGQRLAQMYWRIGKVISKDILVNQTRANYGDHLFKNLAAQLGKSKEVLHKAVKFYEAFPIVSTSTQLGWSHYEALSTIKDGAERKRYYRQAIEKGWSVRELRRNLNRDVKAKENQPLVTPQLTIKRGQLHTCRIKEVAREDGTFLGVDCGFHIYRRVPFIGLRSPKAKDIVTAAGTAGEYRFKLSSVKKTQLFTYKAVVENVVDGDSVPRKAAYEMRDGPSESTCRGRLQSALSGNGQNLLS